MRRQIVAYYAVNGGEGLHDIARAAVATLAQEQPQRPATTPGCEPSSRAS